MGSSANGTEARKETVTCLRSQSSSVAKPAAPLVMDTSLCGTCTLPTVEDALPGHRACISLRLSTRLGLCGCCRMLAGFNPHQQVLGPKDPCCCPLADFWGLQLPENIAFYLKIACPGETPTAQPDLPFAFLPQAWGEHSLKQQLPNHRAGLQVSS